MTTRTIVTSQPDVACDVCERRLLRGENHDVFLAAGRRRLVCDLCAPRAVHEGWMRESEQGVPALPPTRPRRGRSMLERLLQTRLRPDDAPATAARGDASAEDPGYDLLGSRAGSSRAPVAARARAARAAVRGSARQDAGGAPDAEPAEPAEAVELTPEIAALAIFNGSEHPRRIAGVARSLGAPSVSVRSAEHARSVVRIVVAWELCWYRYEVDLDELDAEARVSAQGTELEELGAEERVPNAVATADGLLAPAEG